MDMLTCILLFVIMLCVILPMALLMLVLVRGIYLLIKAEVEGGENNK